MGGGKDKELIDRQHIMISNLIKSESEGDFLQGSMRNGLIVGTKCQFSDKKGNLFQLLCIAHATNESLVMKRSLKYSAAKWKQYIKFLKLYLCMGGFMIQTTKLKCTTTNSKGTSIITTIVSKKYKHQWIHSSKDAWNY
jgi:hypothetical protein